jgi:solute carrier family 35 protein E1
VKKGFEFPFTIAAAQLAVGLVYAIPLWVLGLRKIPNLKFNDIVTILPIVLLNAGLIDLKIYLYIF